MPKNTVIQRLFMYLDKNQESDIKCVVWQKNKVKNP